MARPLILDRYRPIATSGVGGTGIVQIAWDTRIQRRVAIKRLPLGNDPAVASRGLAEARTAAMLSHPTIVSVLDFEIEGAEALLIMEYVDGMTLAQVMDAVDGPLSLDVTAHVVHAVADALSYAHENQVLHLDIKPENILISRDGLVKVSDFGLATLADSEGFAAAQGGTIGYMPPEQIRGISADERTDEWAFASVVYEMLTAENPFDAPDLRRAVALAEEGEVTPPSLIRDDVNVNIDGVLLDALCPEPDVRFDDIDTFADALEPFLGSPKRGRSELRDIVAPPDDADDDWAETGPLAPGDLRSVGLWDRVGERTATIIDRAVCAGAAAWVAWVGLSPIGLPATALALVVIAIAAFSATVPRIAGILAPIAAGAGLAFAGSLPAGLAVIAAFVVWWLLFGRRGTVQTQVVLLAPLLGVARLSCAVPLLAGFRLRPRDAVPAAVFGGLLCAVLCVLTGTQTLYAQGLAFAAPSEVIGIAPAVDAVFAHPRTWILIAGWALAALVMGALCNRMTRFGALLGSFLGSGIMLFAQLVAQRVASGGVWSLPQSLPAVCLLVSFILFGIVSILGAPLRRDDD